MTRRGQDLAASAPVKPVSVLEQRIRGDGAEGPVPPAELLPKGLLVLRKLVLHRLALLKPEIFPLSGEVGSL